MDPQSLTCRSGQRLWTPRSLTVEHLVGRKRLNRLLTLFVSSDQLKTLTPPFASHHAVCVHTAVIPVTVSSSSGVLSCVC